ncbi:hypothetical protein E4U54_000194 [Claviceps lovelessii]|nr:hypothetical protein E4U54_000194 [Claviceps lovelessii]
MHAATEELFIEEWEKLRTQFSDQQCKFYIELVQGRRAAFKRKFEHQFSRRRINWDKYPILQNLVGKLGWKAMTEVIKQIDDAELEAKGKKPSTTCTHIFTSQWGIPCRHIISTMLESGKTLQKIDFDPHWWLKATSDEERRLIEASYEQNPDNATRVRNNAVDLPSRTTSTGRIRDGLEQLQHEASSSSSSQAPSSTPSAAASRGRGSRGRGSRGRGNTQRNTLANINTRIDSLVTMFEASQQGALQEASQQQRASQPPAS